MTKPSKLILILLVAVPVAVAVFWSLNHFGRPLQETPIDFPSKISLAELSSFFNDDFTIMRDLRRLPATVLELYTERGSSRLVMANPGEQFETTDAILDPSLPRKRLIFAGLSKNKCFIQYEQGGIGRYSALALYKFSSEKAEPVWRGVCSGRDFNELRFNIARGNCSEHTY